MIPLPPAELSVVKAPKADRQRLATQIRSTLTSFPDSSKIRPGARVLIKPSSVLLNPDRRDAHLAVLRSLVESIQARGGNVTIGDSPGTMEQPTGQYWQESGLAELAHNNGCELFNFEAARTEAVMVDTRVYYLPVALAEFDLIINAAYLGLEDNRALSGVVSNCLGFLPGRQIAAWDRSEAAVDLYAVVRPSLHILQVDYQYESYLVFSEDGVAIDSVLASRIKSRRYARCLNLAADAGLGLGYLEMIHLAGVALPQEVEPQLVELGEWSPARSVMERLKPINVLKNKQLVAADRCDGCADCCDVCPTASVKMSAERVPYWNMSLCIECFRCREHCHSNAIETLGARSPR